ncbi:hypothetical protein JCM11491_002260 [Sporobolomyces phaffii]
MTTVRPLGLYDKYALAMHGLGKAPAVVFSALVPTCSAPLDAAVLLDTIAALVDREAHLRSSVADARTTEPKFRLNDSVDPNEVLVVVPELAHSAEKALLDAMEVLVGLDIEQAPLWRVWIYAEDASTKLRRVVLGIHHILADGTGAKHLFAEFLALIRSNQNNRHPLEPRNASIPPTLEGTVDLRPSLSTLLRTGFAEFVVPKLPLSLQPRSVPPWPNPAVVSPASRPTAVKLLFLPSDVSSSLAIAAKAHDKVKTLHPVLVVAALSSIANAVLSSASDPSRSLDIKSQTPVSLRSPSLGHPLWTGNFVSTVPHLVPSITRSYLASTPFWALAREFADHLRSPSERQLAREAIGMLSYVPTGDASVPLGQGEPTSWERWLDARMRGDAHPWKSGSFELSNVGRIESTERGVTEVCWSQPGSASGNGLQFNAVSYGGTLSVSLTWRRDAIDEGVVDEIWSLFETTLRKIGRGEVVDGTTLAQLGRESV